MEPQLRDLPGVVHAGGDDSAARGPGAVRVLPPPRRGFIRSSNSTSDAGRCEKKGPLGRGLKGAPVWQGGQSSCRNIGGAPSRAGFRPGSASCPSVAVPQQPAGHATYPVVGSTALPKKHFVSSIKTERSRSVHTNSHNTHLSNPDTHNRDPILHLKQIMRTQLRAAKFNKHRIFLDLFGGVGHISRLLKAQGFAVINFEILNGPHFNLTNPKIIKLIKGWITSHVIAGVVIATPCTSWSRARHGPPHSNWGPIRDNKHIFGIPGVSERDANKLKIGNQTMSATACIVRACSSAGIACILENPGQSMLWLAPPILRVCQISTHRSCTVDFCQFGARWRKRTRLALWNCQFVEPALCKGRGGICSRTGKHHIILSGKDPKSSQLWTQLAQPYPVQFARFLANLLISSCSFNTEWKLHQLFQTSS
jgi:hypothetical protein